MHRPLRLTIDAKAIQSNWRWLQQRAGVPAGAAIKANGYGLGAREAPLVAAGADRRHQPLGLVEADRRDRQAGAPGKLADRQQRSGRHGQSSDVS